MCIYSRAHLGYPILRTGLGISFVMQGILYHFRPYLGIFRANSLFWDTFLFEGRAGVYTSIVHQTARVQRGCKPLVGLKGAKLPEPLHF